MTPAQRARIEYALLKLCDAVDGSGRAVNITPHAITQKGFREELHKLIAMGLPRSKSDVVFFGERGEEAWLTNITLLANALLACCDASGGSDLNCVIPF